VACDLQVPLQEAQSRWWICATCGSYICLSCRALLLETGQATCPGTLVRGVEAHPPHFACFLGPPHKVSHSNTDVHSRVIFLGDVKRGTSPSSNGRVIVLDDTQDSDEENTVNGQ
jgi:hypothetical protein